MVVKIVFLCLIKIFGCGQSFSSEIFNNSAPIEFQVYLSDPFDYSEALVKDGVWIKWNITKKGIPSNAVYGGYDNKGASYVIRADHTTDKGEYVGKIVGKYFPYDRIGYIAYDTKEVKKESFEILIHNRCIWTDRIDPRPMIPGGNGDYICRFEALVTENMTPGHLDANRNFCHIAFGGYEMFSARYQVLRQIC